MLIDLMFSKHPSFDDLCAVLSKNISAIVGSVVWCDGFYVKYMDDIIEINTFSERVTEHKILACFEPMINNDSYTRIRIQRGRICSQYVLQPQESICVS